MVLKVIFKLVLVKKKPKFFREIEIHVIIFSLMLAVNPRSGQPDHMLNVVKFVLHSWRLPQHGLYAINVIRLVGKSSVTAQNALLVTFRGHENAIIKGKFVVFHHT